MFKGIWNCVVSIIKHFFLGLFITITIFPKYFIIGIMCIFSKKARQKRNFNKPIIPIIMMSLSLCTYFICIFLFTRWYVQNERINNLTKGIIAETQFIENHSSNILDDGSDNEYPENVVIEETDNQTDNQLNNENISNAPPSTEVKKQENDNFMSINLASNISVNSDTVGWIYVNGTKINYPVVQAEDNEYYLKHDFYKRQNVTGWVYGDYRANFQSFGRNTIIYGHNLINRGMFGSLVWTLNNSWYSDSNNHYVKISTRNSDSVWQVFSVYVIKPETYYLTTGFTDDSFQKFIDTIKGRSIYNFSVNLGIDDRILTLQTCDDVGTKRVVLHAKLVKLREK